MNNIKFRLAFFILASVFSISILYCNNKTFTSVDELSEQTVFKVMKDSYGFMWIGTSGIHRYDGYEVRKYTNDNSLNYSTDFIYKDIFEDSKGNLWACGERGISKYNRSEDCFFYYDTSRIISDYQIRFSNSIAEDNDGNIWVTSDQGLFIYVENIDKFKLFKNRDSEGNYIGVILSILKDSKGNLWVGTENGNLYIVDKTNEQLIRYKKGSFKEELNSSKRSIHDIFEDSRGLIWLAGNYMAMSINTNTDEQFSLADKYISAELARSITEDNNGNIWIGSANLCIYNPDTKETEIYEYENNNNSGIKSTYIEDLYKDETGTIWISGWHGGIQTYSNSVNNFTSFSHIPYNNNSLSGNIINSFFEDKEGKIWICTEKGDINIFNPLNNTFNTFDLINSKNSEEYYLCIEKGDGDEIFIGSNEALYSFNTKTNRYKKYSHNPHDTESPGGNFIRRIIKGNNNNLWIGITSGKWGGLDEMNLTFNTFTHHSLLPEERECKLPTLSIIDILKDSENNIWVLAWRVLYKYDTENNCFSSYVHDSNNPFSHNPDNIYNISPGRVHCCYQDSKNRLWFGTGSGINIYNPESDDFLSFGNKNGMAGNDVISIMEDKTGNLWLGTDEGISRFNLPSAVCGINKDSSFIDSIPPDFIYFENFNESDGIQKGAFRNASLRSRNGTMYFGGTNGFTTFKPEAIKKDNSVSPLIFTEFRLFNDLVKARSTEYPESPLTNDISVAELITLSHKQYIFSIKWAALNYSSNKKNKYAYYLEGFENDWNYSGYIRSATYTNLPAGNYVFKVKTSNNEGKWATESISINIKVLPPWWNTVWFKLLLSITAILIISTIYIARIRSLKKQQHVLENRVSERTKALEIANDELKSQTIRVEKQNIKIKQISDELHEADQEKLKFFTNVSHEFRTPLTLILAHLDLISEKLTHNSTKVIKNNAVRLLDMINQLIEIRKTDKGHVSLNVTHFELIEFTKSITNSFETLAKQKGITLQFYSLSDRINIWLDTDKTKAILNNLISNAIKYTNENKNITVSVKEQGKSIAIEVEDEGIGIKSTELENIFDRFYRTSNNSEMGHGIGLNYVKFLTELQSGIISVSSEPGKGSKFTVFFKTGKDHFSENDIKTNVKTEVTIPETYQEEVNIEFFNTEYDILLVEDNYELTDYISGMLSKHFSVKTAANGMEALSVLKNYTPELIISDIMMPVMDGIEFCKNVKSSTEFSHIPFIMLTAKTDTDTKIEGFLQGIDHYIEKPFNSGLLLAKIKSVINIRLQLKEYFSTAKIFNESDKNILSKRDKDFWNKFIESINSNYSDSDFNVNNISSDLNMTVPTFYRKFKSLTGQAPAEYLRKFRIHKAAGLLKNDGVNVNQASINVGFKSLSQFRKNFKEEFGKNPSEFTK